MLAGVEKGQREGARVGRAEAILNELDAARAALALAAPGDVVVMCVDDAAAVYREAVSTSRSGGGAAIADPGELEAEEG